MKSTVVKDIAKEFGLQIHGDSSRTVDHLGSLKRRKPGGLFWAKNSGYLSQFTLGTVICTESDFSEIEANEGVTYLTTNKSARLLYAKVATHLLEDEARDLLINDVETHRKNPNITISDNVFIGKGVTIGDGTVIHPNVCIYTGSKIGGNCVIKANASIATEGLGLEFDDDAGLYFKFPQVGGVILEDHVEIGPNSTIRKSALDDTIIGMGTKLGALCNIGHNCIVGKNCILTCNVIASGSSIIGDKVYLGVGSTIKHGANIGNGATIGQGAVVVKNVPDNETWVGNPAKQIQRK